MSLQEIITSLSTRGGGGVCRRLWEAAVCIESVLLQPKRFSPHTIWYVARLLLAFGCWLLQALSTPVNHICLPKMGRASPNGFTKILTHLHHRLLKASLCTQRILFLLKSVHMCTHFYWTRTAAPGIHIKPHCHLSCPGNFITYAVVPNGGYFFSITSKTQEGGVNRSNQPQELQSEIRKAAIEAKPPRRSLPALINPTASAV